ncbi:MAG: SLBB domain-containing protein [Christensenellaceae bacterium]|nr:SLBB domain-containing protein [Christensenellaceae bacterium]
MADFIESIRNAGVIGAGGAGFPTHVKVNCKGKAEYIIANGAECEPLLRVDQQVMALHADKVVAGILAVKEYTEAKHAVIALKEHYHDAVAALEKAAKGKGVEIRTFDSYYPLGDEQQLVYEITGRVVPTGGLPLDVGAVVNNVSTLINIANALEGKPVTDKYVTVGGAVKNPVTLCVPIGTPISELLKFAGAPADMQNYTIILGGPCMGKITKDINTPVTKTTGGVLVIPSDHPLIRKKTSDPERDAKMALAVCCQCMQCTQLCPRNALGLNVQPHKAMRAAAYNDGSLLGDVNGIFSCCDCGICSYYACNFDLSPSRMMQRLKGALVANGVRPNKEVYGEVDPAIDMKRVPTGRLISRLGISEWDVPAPVSNADLAIKKTVLSLKMHIGAPAVPVVKVGDTVKAGDLVAEIKEGALGARVHAGISGTVTSVDGAITIEV